jgi:hypothetical protein
LRWHARMIASGRDPSAIAAIRTDLTDSKLAHFDRRAGEAEAPRLAIFGSACGFTRRQGYIVFALINDSVDSLIGAYALCPIQERYE